jgi:hypothetical protein
MTARFQDFVYDRSQPDTCINDSPPFCPRLVLRKGKKEVCGQPVKCYQHSCEDCFVQIMLALFRNCRVHTGHGDYSIRLGD